MDIIYKPTYGQTLKSYFRQVDWPLLVFLVLFLQVKLYIKIVAVILAMCMGWKGWRIRDITDGRWPLWWRFYAAMIILSLINLLLSFSTLTLPAWYAFGLGCVYWLLAMMAAWQVFLFVQRGDKKKIHSTISFFFLLNAGIMALSLLRLCIQAGVLNPYDYEGEHRKFFISTGDRITGIGLDSSVTAALISAFGVLFFLYRGGRGAALFCFIAVLLATSNTVDYMLMTVLVLGFLFIPIVFKKA